MNPERNEFGHFGFDVGAQFTPVIVEDYPSSEYDPHRAINSGGLSVKMLSGGWRLYDVNASIDTESQREIDRIIAGDVSDDGGVSMEDIIKFVLPKFLVMPGACVFQVAQDTKLAISPTVGVMLKTDSTREDGDVVTRSFEPGRNNALFPVKAPHYIFQITSEQRDTILQEDGQKFGTECTAGIRLKTLNFSAIREDLELLRKHKLLTDQRVREYIDPFFKVRLKPLEDFQEVADTQMW